MRVLWALGTSACMSERELGDQKRVQKIGGQKLEAIDKLVIRDTKELHLRTCDRCRSVL